MYGRLCEEGSRGATCREPSMLLRTQHLAIPTPDHFVLLRCERPFFSRFASSVVRFFYFYFFSLSVLTFSSIHFVLHADAECRGIYGCGFATAIIFFWCTSRSRPTDRKRCRKKELLLLASASRETQKVFHEYNLRFLCSTIFHSMPRALSPGRPCRLLWQQEFPKRKSFETAQT